MKTPSPKMPAFRNRGCMRGSLVCAMMIVLLSAAAPQSSAVTWVGTGANAYWGNTANWTGGVPAGGADSIVTIASSSGFYNSGNLFLADASGVDTAYTVGSYIFGNAGGAAYTFSLKNVSGGTASLTFDVASGNALLRFTQQFASSIQQINTAVVLNDTLSINAKNTAGSNLINGAISSGVAGTGLSIDGDSGNVGVALGGVNTYTGGTNISASYGKLRLITGSDRLPTSTILTVNGGATSAGNFNLNTFSQKVGGLAAGGGAVQGTISNDGAGTGTATLTVESTTVNSTFDGIIKDGATAKIALIKAGAGTKLILTGTNTYTGTTTISGGTLVVNGSLASGSVVSVGASGILGGSGTIGGTVAVSGTLSPGNSPGLLTTGSQTWSNGGNYNWQVVDANGVAGTGFDSIAISSGGLNLSGLTTGGFSINLWSLSSIGPDVNGNALNFDNSTNHTWTLVSNTGNLTSFAGSLFIVNIGASNGTSGFTNDLGGGSFSVVGTANSLDLVFTAATIPEPSTYATICGVLALGGIVWKRQRRA